MSVLRIIARLNVGGPAIQAITLTKALEAFGYSTVLLRGHEAPHEGTMDHLAEAQQVTPVRIRGLRRGLGLHDLRAFWGIMGWLRRARPAVLHTHTAKAGALGRLAAFLSPLHRPKVVVHTFHGHVLKGEFPPRVSRVIAWVERQLARRTTRLIAVSAEIRDDLVAFGVAPRSKIEVIPLGFDLSRFTVDDTTRARLRAETRARWGIPADARVVVLIARVVKIKRVDRFLAMARRLADVEDAWFVVAGDGDRREELAASDDALALGDRLVWAGFERDIPSVCFASDVAVLSSDNEGTPVCLIEAQAAGLPVVTTRCGGVASVVRQEVAGLIVERDAAALAQAVRALLGDAQRRAEYGRRGRDFVLAAFSLDRLVDDIHSLYARLLNETGGAPEGAGRRAVQSAVARQDVGV